MVSRATIGDFQVSLVRAGYFRWDAGAYFGVVPKKMWSRKMAADEENRIGVAFNCYLIETGDHTILVETGGGDKMPEKSWQWMGRDGPVPPLPEVLAAHSVDPEKIDVVINSHLHWDHCSGNTFLRDGAVHPAFPRARYYTRRGEWEHAHTRHPRDSVSYFDSNYDPLVESGQMLLLDCDGEVVPGVSVHVTPGHNRDMMIVKASSKGETFCFFSDLVPTTAHFTPTWVLAFDVFPLETIDNKTVLLEQAERENWMCGFAHDAQVAFARVARDARAGFLPTAEIHG